MKIASRREFLGGAAALAASPALAQLPVQLPIGGEVDVAVVGAGAAGIAAARRVAAAGKSCVVLEAHARIGGRVWTAAGKLGVPHDRGAHRISGSGRNPMIALGRLGGFKFVQPTPLRRLLVGMREARDSEYDNFTTALHRANRAIVAAGEAGLDLAAAQALPDLGTWRGTVSFVLGPLSTSKDLEEVSSVDYARAEDQPDELICVGGLARFMEAAAEPLRVELSAPVNRIDTRGRDAVTLETERGLLHAQAVIVTASTNALRADYIKFEPALPKRTIDALAGLTLGTRDRLIFELAGNPFQFADDQRIVFRSDDRRTIALIGRISGSDLAYAEFCGRFGLEMSNAGDGAMYDFVAETLAAQFGTDAKKAMGRSEVVRWSREPYILGATSVAAPGSAGNRRMLAAPVHHRIFFAGEALHETWWGTVAGAWVSGERAADAVLRQIAQEPAAPERKTAPRRRK